MHPTSQGTGELRSVQRFLESELEAKHWKLAVGDGLIIEAPASFKDQFATHGHFAVVREVKPQKSLSDKKKPKGDQNKKMIISGCLVLGMILLVATNTLPLLPASMTCVFCLVWTDCLSLTKAIAAVNLRTTLTIVGAFGVGKAMSKTHVATVLAHILVACMAPFGTIGLLAAISVATCTLGIVFHATAVVGAFVSCVR